MVYKPGSTLGMFALNPVLIVSIIPFAITAYPRAVGLVARAGQFRRGGLAVLLRQPSQVGREMNGD